MAQADIGGKRLVSLAPDAWCQWVTQSADVVAQEIIDGQFQFVARQNDVLIKAKSPEHGEFLIVCELQFRYNSAVPRRVRAYAGLAEEKFKLPTFPVLVNILPPDPPVKIKESFKREFMGLQARQDYRVLNLWEVDAGIVFRQEITTLLPFVPVLENGGDEKVIRRAAQLLQQDPQLSELESLLGFFARFVLDSQLVSQILRWDMVVLRQSPWYQEILQEGKVGGIFEGEQSLVLRLLERRVGPLSPQLLEQVQALSLSQIEALGEALLDFSETADLVKWLQAM